MGGSPPMLLESLKAAVQAGPVGWIAAAPPPAPPPPPKHHAFAFCPHESAGHADINGNGFFLHDREVNRIGNFSRVDELREGHPKAHHAKHLLAKKKIGAREAEDRCKRS